MLGNINCCVFSFFVGWFDVQSESKRNLRKFKFTIAICTFRPYYFSHSLLKYHNMSTYDVSQSNKNTLNKWLSIKVLKKLILYNLPMMLTILLMCLALVGKYVAFLFIIVFIFESCWASLGCIYIVLFCFDSSVIEKLKKLLFCCITSQEDKTNETAPLLPEL